MSDIGCIPVVELQWFPVIFPCFYTMYIICSEDTHLENQNM